MDLRSLGFLPDVLYEVVVVTRFPNGGPPNAAAMGVKVASPGAFLVRPFADTDTCANLAKGSPASVNVTPDPLTFALAALRGWNAGPSGAEFPEDRYDWNEAGVPFLKGCSPVLFCRPRPAATPRPARPDALPARGPRRLAFSLEVTGSRSPLALVAAPVRAHALVLEATVHATRVKVHLDSGDENAANLSRHEALRALEAAAKLQPGKLAWEATLVVAGFLEDLGFGFVDKRITNFFKSIRRVFRESRCR